MKKQTLLLSALALSIGVIVVGPASGSSILTDSGARPGRVTEPGADAGKGPASGGQRAGGRHRLADAQYAGRAEEIFW